MSKASIVVFRVKLKLDGISTDNMFANAVQ